MALRKRQYGATLTEFVVVAPLIIVIGLTGLQLALLYQARLALDLAAYEAARSGSRSGARPQEIRDAWFRGLTPLLSGAALIPRLPSDARLAAKAVRTAAVIKESLYTRIEILNPTTEAFTDFADPALQRMVRSGGRRVIPNHDLAARPRTPGPHSGLSIQDANILRLRIVYGYQPRVPLVGRWFSSGLSLLAGGTDPFRQGLMAVGRVPVVVEVSMPMLSPAIESSWVASAAEASGEESPGEEGGGSDGGSEPGGHGSGNGNGHGQSGGAGGTGGQPGGGAEDDFCTV